MRRRLIGVLADACLIAVVPAVAVTAAPSSSRPVGQIACTRAKIGGQSGYIARGQYSVALRTRRPPRLLLQGRPPADAGICSERR